MKARALIVITLLTFLFSVGASTPMVWRTSATTTSNSQLAKPAGIDLDVTYIRRTPLYNRYSVGYTTDGRPYLQPGTESDKRWPSQGEIVTFTAHIINKGTIASGAFTFKWYIDGVEVANGTHGSLLPNQETTESYQWAWAHSLSGERLLGAHTVKFTVDPNNAIFETYESNNFVEDRTDAISLYLAVPPELYAALEVPVNSQWPFSAEDWLQKQIAAMNEAFARSVYPSAPNGITERVRLDQILITSSPPEVGLSADGGFFMTSDDRQGNSYYDSLHDVSGGLIHELTHQLGIIDMYNLDASLEVPQVLDQFGQPVQMEFASDSSFPGLMNNPGTQPLIYDAHTSLALNVNKGYRRGYYGEYLYDVSDQVYLRILDNQGNPAAGVTVKLYQRSSSTGLYGSVAGTIDNTPEIAGVTDGNGKLLLANRSVGSTVTTNTGHVLHDNPFGLVNVVGNNDEFIFELAKGSHQEFHWLDITAFNSAMWQDGSSSSTLEISSHVPPINAPNPPTNLTAVQESGLVKLRWSASSSSGVVGYNIYRTSNSADQYVQTVSRTTAISYSDPYDDSRRSSTYTVTAVDSQGRESGFSNPFYAFRLSNPAGIVVDDQNGYTVLDPQNGYALLYQPNHGRFFDTRGSVDYHLEFSQYIARDPEGRLILSHPGDYYTSRHSIRVADRDANPLFEFGDQGSGAGQFQTPAGVAAWGQACGIEGPYLVDPHTLLLLHLDNSYGGAQGETGNSNGVTFTTGKYTQAITVDSNDTLTYPTADNLNRSQGAIEFWIRPHWNGNDNQSYTFFEVGNSWFNRMRIMKDGANNLRFMVWDSTTEYGVAYNVGGWQAGEWHHVAATWEGTSITLYVDGRQMNSNNTVNLPVTLSSTFYVGSSSGFDQQANADVDEFRISDMPRVGNSDTCSYRILVADSGNNRIQAFDGQGNFIAAYGGSGAGIGQFHNPQGLAVNNTGDVIVVDSGNNRLQVLSFNGSNFGFVRSITANFNGPTGIATDDLGRILVADTGDNKIKVLDIQGNLLTEYSAPNGGRTGTFNQPRGVAVDRNGDIIVADTGNKRVVSILGTSSVEVGSITRVDSNPTSSMNVSFRITFTRSVTGVDTTAPYNDFALATTGVTSAAITSVSGSGDTYAVTVNTGTGSGMIRLDVVDNDSIKDAANNPLGGIGAGNGSFTTGETYTVTQGANIKINTQLIGNYPVLQNQSTFIHETNIVDGPVQVTSARGGNLFASERVISGTSFNEVMGYPANQLTTEYWFPWYDNISMSTWLLVGNASSTQAATVDIYVGGTKRGSYTIPVNGRVTPRFNLQTGPVRVVSTNGVEIFTSERTQYGPDNSFNEVMGYPANQFTTEYWFPWYDNTSMNTWVLVGNPSTTSSAKVDIYIGGVKRGSYTITKGKSVTQRFNIQPTGPVRVVSTNGVKIFASERTIASTSFNEVMGYPGNQLTTGYWYPWYDNVGMATWVLVGNPTTSSANVDIFIGGVKQGSYTVKPGAQINLRFSLNTGPVHVVSTNGVKIFSSERAIYGSSFNEVMGYPGDKLTTEYWFPWYDSSSMSTDIVVGIP